MPFNIDNRNMLFKSIMNDEPYFDHYEFCFQQSSTKSLIIKMLNKNPKDRITPLQALNHEFFKQYGHNLKLYNSRKQKHLINMKIAKLQRSIIDNRNQSSNSNNSFIAGGSVF